MKDLQRKDFNMLTRFDMKSDGESSDGETLTIKGTANFMGATDDQGYGTYVDLANEVVQISGLDVSTWKSNPIILWQHNTSKPIGKGLKIEKRKEELYVEAQIYKSVCGDEIFNAIKAGVVTTFSIGFRVIQSDWREVNKTQIRYIMKSRLYEISCVSIPCNSESRFQVIKSSPNSEGFYAGDLEDSVHKNFSSSNENENQYQIEGDTMQKQLKSLLSVDAIDQMKALGLEDVLESEVEVKSEVVMDAKLKALKAEILGDIKTLLEETLKKEAPASEETPEEEAAPEEESTENTETPEEEKEAPAVEFSQEFLDTMKAFHEELEGHKPQLENE